MNPGGKWTERTSSEEGWSPALTDAFGQFFERTVDAVWLLDPRTGIFVDCNQAAVTLMRAQSKKELLRAGLKDLSPPYQADGRESRLRMAEILRTVQERGSLRFEWILRRSDGQELPLEVILTPIQVGARILLVTMTRELNARKEAEMVVRQLNLQLERRIAERTNELVRSNENLRTEIFERQRTESLLKESEARARTLVEHAPDAIVVFDLDTGCFVEANQNAARLYGISREELMKLGPADLSPALQSDGRPSWEVVREKLLEAEEGGTPVFDWWHRTADGRIIPCEVRLVRLPAHGRRLIRGSILDYSERQRRERIQQATYQISEAIHLTDDLDSLFRRIHGTIQGLMPANNFYIALRDPASEVFTFPYFVDEMDPPPNPMRLTSGLTSYVLKTSRPLLVNRGSAIRKQSAGVAVLMEGAEEVPYVEVGTPAAVWLGVPLNILGRTIGVMAVQDYREERVYGDDEKQILTYIGEQIALAIDRKRAEQALRESEAKFRALFEASSQGVMLHDEEKFLEVNSATVRILGYNDASEIVGKHPSETSAPVQPNGEPADRLARLHIEKCMAQGSTRFEWLGRNLRGEDVPIEVILTRIPMGGRPIIQAVIHDISDRKKAEAELLRALAREKELGQLKSDFVSMVSHEFRTPLGIILSSAEILQDYLEQLPVEDRQQHLRSIAKNTRRMADLMEEVLLLGRFEAGKMDFRPAPLELGGFCRRLAEEILSATDRRCPIQLTIEPLPGEVRADERLLRHILTNLLSNAVKYSDAGRKVHFMVRVEGPEAVLVVQDEGIGISKADLEWLFSAFHRGHNVGLRPGTGLGMVIVKRCVELQGGNITIESLVGKGTTVTVRLPVLT